MNQISMINSMLEWERAMEIEDARRMMNRFEDVFTEETGWKMNEPVRSETFFSWLEKNKKKQEEARCYGQDCREVPAR
jgi:hypothetical protein